MAAGPTDEDGNLEAAAAGQVVLSVPSPEALRRQAEDAGRVIREAGTGAEPLVVSVGVGRGAARRGDRGAAGGRRPRPASR